MPKFPTFPTLYNDARQISLSKLKKWGYFKPGQGKGCKLAWGKNETGSVLIQVNALDEQNPYIKLEYNYLGKPINYRIQLIPVPSNLGIGVSWYFLCPRTGKRCRKLYWVDGYFFHREAFKGCMYESQTQSKKYRGLDNTLVADLRTDQLYEQLYKKHFKKQYAGKPTKKFLKLIHAIQRIEGSLSDEEILQLMRS